jgi:hypothetical protein
MSIEGPNPYSDVENIDPAIAAADNWDSLYRAILDVDKKLQSTDGQISAAKQILFINEIRKGAVDVTKVTRSYGIRAAVTRLLSQEA